MSFWNWLTRRRDDHGWPGYIVNGRIRTSTAGLIAAFFVITWVHNTYQPPPQAPAVPETAQVVPPGFMPDPEYTWVPRTNVETRPRTTETSPTTTTTTTETSPTDTTSPSDTSSATTTSGPAPTTVVDPDGPGPLPASTVTPSPSTVPNRSGSVTTTTGVLPGILPPSPAALPPG